MPSKELTASVTSRKTPGLFDASLPRIHLVRAHLTPPESNEDPILSLGLRSSTSAETPSQSRDI